MSRARASSSTWWWLVLALGLLVLSGGGAIVALSVSERQKRVRRALRDAAQRHGLNPDVLEAIGYVETRWNPTLANMSGTDGARGGAHGPTQITERTAREHGYTGTMAALRTEDASLAAEWTARIMKARPGGGPVTLEDAVAWWNAGRTSFAALGPTHVTRTDYAPKARTALAIVRASPVA